MHVFGEIRLKESSTWLPEHQLANDVLVHNKPYSYDLNTLAENNEVPPHIAMKVLFNTEIKLVSDSQHVAAGKNQRWKLKAMITYQSFFEMAIYLSTKNSECIMFESRKLKKLQCMALS